MATNIPKARQLLSAALAAEDPAFKDVYIRLALRLMKRKVNRRPAPVEARSVTAHIVSHVLVDLEVHPDMSTRQIGERYGINAGRVSEIANGLRTVANPKMAADGLSEDIRNAMKEEPDG